MITRFAPSPTGPLHLGHAYSAMLAHDMARADGGQFLLRIEDIDQTRARPHWEEQIYEDLDWLGITWDAPPLRQSDRSQVYHEALKALWDKGVLYPCTCNRRDIITAASAPQEGAEPAYGPDGLIYPGTCRQRERPADMPAQTALRLDLSAVSDAPETLSFLEMGEVTNDTPKTVRFQLEDLKTQVGDFIVSRREFLGSYHLSVVLDDAAQGITHVIRGRDIFDATKIHVLLQQLLGLPTPTYLHHRLIRDEAGKRLAKRDDARAISKFRADGATPADIRRMVGLDIASR
ncbi:tRNA glutamyl-Q(34) synthetase GluQRS [Thalassovita sp.]|jgi:glutamyl-Q tRNA(Asp) synthetase|uniref:tRNA glutamyl-Q(34) synthetase GluQRS n=1 Tax=Thalassovita sp. TaxID=1979401 RepID=UPI003B5AD56D